MTQPTGEDPLAAIKPYVQLASGLMGMSAAKAAEFAQGFLSPGADAGAPGESTEEGLSVDRVRAIAREEVDRAARRLGFVREDELASMRREVDRLERLVADLAARMPDGASDWGAPGKGKKKSGSKKPGPKSGGE